MNLIRPRMPNPGFHLAHATYSIPKSYLLFQSNMYCSSFDQFLTKCWSWTGIHLPPRRSKPTQECARFNIFQKRQIIPIAHFYGKAHTILVVGMITIQPEIFLNRRPISFFWRVKCTQTFLRRFFTDWYWLWLGVECSYLPSLLLSIR